ncbi:hypothetical protein AXW37_07875 [Yersinia ruckeri]|nr:hypothetical protein AXW22_07645 [Yersinia ruckeri]OJB71628.1 hypothetical protein A9Q64_07620 [Yersinia ruckeri]OJB72375.1 hypothetical protein A9Q63_07635 [Yersinia ruckeri]OJB73692.1 hypothetical protein A9Q65_07625 [Yersinia ruckeri]OJB79430.1 hypothetical protein A9Q61_07910 [Yersinia ruckeri]
MAYWLLIRLNGRFMMLFTDIYILSSSFFLLYHLVMMIFIREIDNKINVLNDYQYNLDYL